MTSLSQTDFISAAIYQRACKSVVFVLPASVLRFIFQYSFIRLLRWHPAGGGPAANTIYYPQSREDAQILSSSRFWFSKEPRFLLEVTKSVWFQTSNRILKLVIRIGKFLGRQGMIGLVPVSVCLIVSDCFLWTHQICFLLGPKITLYSNQCLDMVREGHQRMVCDHQRMSWSIDASVRMTGMMRLTCCGPRHHHHPGVWPVTRLGAANLRQPRGLGIWRTLGSECRRSCQLRSGLRALHRVSSQCEADLLDDDTRDLVTSEWHDPGLCGPPGAGEAEQPPLLPHLLRLLHRAE